MTATNAEKIDAKFTNLESSEKLFIIGVFAWTVPQLSRAIAFTLMGEIYAGGEDAAWLYPAYLDIFAVVFALPLAWAMMAWRNVLTWAAALV